MTLEQINKVTTFCAGTLVAAESALLLFGMNYPGPTAWSDSKNLAMASTDILLGGALIWFSLSGNEYENNPWYYAALAVLGATHVFREIEYLSPGLSNEFAANLPLFVLNNVRLGLLGGSLGMSLSIKY